MIKMFYILFLFIFYSSSLIVFSQHNVSMKQGVSNGLTFSSYSDKNEGNTQNQIKNVKDNVNFVPTVFSLKQNYPNPFNPSTVIEYSLPVKSNVELTIYNMLGVKVATLVKSFLEAGIYKVEFDGTDLSSGLYVYQLKTDKITISRKMLLLK